MIRTIFLTGSAMLGVALALPSVATEGQRAWTLDDQLTVPEIRTLAIAAVGMSADYVVRIADRASDTTVAVLSLSDLASGKPRELIQAVWTAALGRIPGTHDAHTRTETRIGGRGGRGRGMQS